MKEAPGALPIIEDEGFTGKVRSMLKLWHCKDARSLRVLWALEEMGLAYELEVLPFPPRVFDKSYLEVNILGTVPYFVDGDIRMTESIAICHYLVAQYAPGLGIETDHPEYGAFLNWLYHADATLTFPQTLVVRYMRLENTPEKIPVAIDYAKWFFARLKLLDQHVQTREFLCDGRFTIADIAIGYALYLGKVLEIEKLLERSYSDALENYIARLQERPAFVRANEFGVIGPESFN